MLSLPLENYILTFDDGLYNQYAYYMEHLRHVNTQKIFFISTGIVCDGPQSTKYLSCSEAHAKAFAGNKEDYMTLEQIRELSLMPDVEIGGHSHNHHKIMRNSSLFSVAKHIRKDTEQMMAWFATNLGYVPESFCFPYNNDVHGIYEVLLKDKFSRFYGAERIPVETLLRSEIQTACHEMLP